MGEMYTQGKKYFHFYAKKVVNDDDDNDYSGSERDDIRASNLLSLPPWLSLPAACESGRGGIELNIRPDAIVFNK
jgi:hypothetical protein